ncbi:MAG: DUF4266 domain-containing protein [Myxococcales bacterium]|jgi:hypothetical protein|nr:DUF4266 domain-containing protein [Myxococcales bacterium]MBL0194997.1 DUF4266 domain-containing protein [Myxococcales bacterium]HQY60389.1 DUF4266 domain-containing protein [Polyangiaceae bacterium]
MPVFAAFTASGRTLPHDARASLRPAAALFALALTAVAALTQTACVKVAPYERGTLAHPTMTTDDVSLGVDAHVRGVSEGAAGGLGGGGGGCGCN